MSKQDFNRFEIVDLCDCELIDKDPQDDEEEVQLTGLWELTGHSEDIIEITQQDFEDEDPHWTIEQLADELMEGDHVTYKDSVMIVQAMEKYPDGDGGFNLSVMLTDN